MAELTRATAALELTLLRAPDTTVREAAWERLIAGHSRLLLAVARSFGGDHDDSMERYAYILEKCREQVFRRLRAFDPNGAATFSTWLTVAARRLCVDHDRAVVGRHRTGASSAQATARRALRRALSGEDTSGMDVDCMSDDSQPSAEVATVRAERDAELRDAVAALTSRERLLLALRFEDDLPASRIAGVLGLSSPFHVYRQLNTVLGRLRSVLARRGIDDLEE